MKRSWRTPRPRCPWPRQSRGTHSARSCVQASSTPRIPHCGARRHFFICNSDPDTAGPASRNLFPARLASSSPPARGTPSARVGRPAGKLACGARSTPACVVASGTIPMRFMVRERLAAVKCLRLTRRRPRAASLGLSRRYWLAGAPRSLPCAFCPTSVARPGRAPLAAPLPWRMRAACCAATLWRRRGSPGGAGIDAFLVRIRVPCPRQTPPLPPPPAARAGGADVQYRVRQLLAQAIVPHDRRTAPAPACRCRPAAPALQGGSKRCRRAGEGLYIHMAASPHAHIITVSKACLATSARSRQPRELGKGDEEGRQRMSGWQGEDGG